MLLYVAFSAAWIAGSDRVLGSFFHDPAQLERMGTLKGMLFIAVTDSAGKVSNYVGVFADISRLKASETELDFLVHHDPLTELPNRALLLSYLEHGIRAAQRDNTRVALLMLDLDRFKDVNDSFGHGAGAEVRVGVSIGISLYPDHGGSTQELLQHADAALYQAKHEGRSCFRYFSQNLTRAARERIDLEARSNRTSCACTTSRWSTSAAAASSAPKRWCAGRIRRKA